jgi:hypothetical protein
MDQVPAWTAEENSLPISNVSTAAGTDADPV